MKTEIRVLTTLLFALLAFEGAARCFEGKLSKDVDHLRGLPDQAKRLREAAPECFKVLILGNSLAREGVNQTILRDGIGAKTGRPVELAAMHPDGSRIEEWQMGYRRYFDQTGSCPDLVLLCTGRAHLLDGLRDLDSVAAFHASWGDFPVFARSQNLGVGGICQALASRSSRLIAHRKRVQPLLFYHCIPRYEQTVNLVQALRGKMTAKPPRAEETCKAFTDLLRTFDASGTQVVLLPVPMPEPYRLPEVVTEAASMFDVRVLRPIVSLPRVRFPDGYHLDAEGSEVWTKSFMRELLSLDLDGNTRPH